ncbi:MAG: hypothetical protein QXK37_05175 [Candidatus Woesearchaeota archaeon]
MSGNPWRINYKDPFKLLEKRPGLILAQVCSMEDFISADNLSFIVESYSNGEFLPVYTMLRNVLNKADVRNACGIWALWASISANGILAEQSLPIRNLKYDLQNDLKSLTLKTLGIVEELEAEYIKTGRVSRNIYDDRNLWMLLNGLSSSALRWEEVKKISIEAPQKKPTEYLYLSLEKMVKALLLTKLPKENPEVLKRIPLYDTTYLSIYSMRYITRLLQDASEEIDRYIEWVFKSAKMAYYFSGLTDIPQLRSEIITPIAELNKIVMREVKQKKKMISNIEMVKSYLSELYRLVYINKHYI